LVQVGPGRALISRLVSAIVTTYGKFSIWGYPFRSLIKYCKSTPILITKYFVRWRDRSAPWDWKSFAPRLGDQVMIHKRLIRGRLWYCALILAWSLVATGAQADSVTFTFGGSATTWTDTPFPNANSTYLTAVFTDIAPNQVKLVLTPNLIVDGITKADIDDIAFNMNLFITDLSATGPDGFTFDVAEDGEKISSFKKLDIKLDEGQHFANSILEGTTPITIYLTGTSPQALTASVFNAQSPKGDYAVAKIQSREGSFISTSNGAPSIVSAEIAEVTTAPLQSTAVGGAGLLISLGVCQARRIRRRQMIGA
jgi:hypothetical protein